MTECLSACGVLVPAPGSDQARRAELMARAIDAMRLSVVVKLLAADAHLARAMLPAMVHGALAPHKQPVHFVQACLERGLLGPMARAFAAGLSPDAPVFDAGATLAQAGAARNDAAAVSVAIMAGCQVNAPGRGATRDGAPAHAQAPILYTALMQAIDRAPKDGPIEPRRLDVVALLLDAGASVRYDPHYALPALIVARRRWSDARAPQQARPDDSDVLGKLLGTLAAKGCDLSAASGPEGLTPLRAALGARNAGGALSLIALGVDTSRAALGAELFDLVRAARLPDFEQQVHGALIRASARAAQRPDPAGAPAQRSGHSPVVL